MHEQWGAYQEYTVAPAATTFPIPDKTSFEEASTIPLAGMTGALGLFVKLGIPAPGSAEVGKFSHLKLYTLSLT